MKKKKLTLILGITFTALVLVGLQVSVWGKFADPDGFYHAKASQLLAAGKLSDTLPQLAYTTWNEGFADQHYLYHWLLIPFNNVHWLQLSVIVFGIIFVALFWWLMGELKISHKPLWLFLLLAGSVDFLFRINLIKANTLSLALLCAVGIFIYRFHSESNKAKWLTSIAFISGLFVWTYGGFVCVPLFVGAYCAALLIAERKFEIRPLLASCAGIAAGLFLHPHSHHLLNLLYDQLFQTGLGAGSVVPAGNEWLPFDLEWFVRSNLLILLAWLLAIIVELNLFTKKTLQWQNLWLHIVAIGFVILALWHRRFVEYWLPFAVLASAITLAPYLAKVSWSEFKNAIGSLWPVRLLVILLIFLIVMASSWNIQQVQRSLAGGVSGNKYQAAAQWLQNNSQSGDLVLNTQWDQFPQLFYWNDKNYYMVGLDPTFMYLFNQDLYWQWRNVADDNPGDWQSVEELHYVIAEQLKAKFVFIEIDRNQDLYNYLLNKDALGKNFELGYSSDDIAIFRVK